MAHKSLVPLFRQHSAYTPPGLSIVSAKIYLSFLRSFNCLKRANINTVADLISKTEDEMMKVRNLGRKSLEEVIGKLEAMGLSLADEENN